MTACDSCKTAFPRPEGAEAGEDYPDPFCVGCGDAYPWATRAQRIGSLYNLIDFAELSANEELAVIEAIAISEPEEEPGSRRHVMAGEALQRTVPAVWTFAQPILRATLSGELQKALHLHP